MLEYVKTIKQVRNALDNLGITGDALMLEIDGDPTRLQVFVNDEYIGIFDAVKNTFVD